MSLRRLILRLISISQVWRLFRWWNRGRVKILMYHGVTELPVMNWTQIHIADFENQMRYVGEHFTPVRLDEVVDMLSGKLPLKPHAVAVTFDDGFRNNLTTAQPVLQRYHIPATVFIATSFIDGSPRFGGFIWTDYIFALLEGTPCEELDIRDLGLGRYELRTTEQRYAAKESICGYLKQVDHQEKDRVIEILHQKLGGRISPEVREVFAPMNWEEVRQLQAGSLVDVGAHTENHEILSRLSEDKMTREILGSQARLQEQLGRPVVHFAYPNGTPDDFTDRTAAVVEQNFSCALTTISGQNEPGVDLYKLRRLSIGRDSDMIQFKLSLSGVTDFLYAVKRAMMPRRASS